MKYSLQSKDLLNFAPMVSFEEGTRVWFNSKELQADSRNLLGSIEYGKQYSLRMLSRGVEKQFKLYFTSFPIARIIHIEEIKDEPKSLGRIYISDSGEQEMFDSYIGVEIRGGSSQLFDKQSYGFNFCTRRDLDSRYSLPVLGMNSLDRWMLDAMYIDPSKMRNQVSVKLWQDMFSEDNIQTNIQFTYVELFLNHSFMGVYCLSQPMSPQLLGIEGTSQVLYKADAYYGGVSRALDAFYSDMPTKSFRWDGWEQEYPEYKPCWEPFSKFRELLINATDSEFESEIEKLIDLPSFIDYFIFMNL